MDDPERVALRLASVAHRDLISNARYVSYHVRKSWKRPIWYSHIGRCKGPCEGMAESYLLSSDVTIKPQHVSGTKIELSVCLCSRTHTITFPKARTPPKGRKELRLPRLTGSAVDRSDRNLQVDRKCRFYCNCAFAGQQGGITVSDMELNVLSCRQLMNWKLQHSQSSPLRQNLCKT